MLSRRGPWVASSRRLRSAISGPWRGPRRPWRRASVSCGRPFRALHRAADLSCWGGEEQPMRLFALFAVCFVTGCLRNAPGPTGLYKDEEIRRLADFDIDKESNGLQGIFEIKCLDVVPSGSSRPRAEVLAALGIGAA